MRYKLLPLMGLSFAFILSACGSDGGSSSKKSHSYKYNFQVQNCSPSVFKGRFKSSQEMCNALAYQAQLYPCAAPQIFRVLEDNNCHRGDFLQGSNSSYIPSGGIFYNVDNDRYMLTPEGSIKLEQPRLDDQRIHEEQTRHEQHITIEDGLRCIQGICIQPHETIEIRGNQAIINGEIIFDLNLNESDIAGPNAPVDSGTSTLVRPGSSTDREQVTERPRPTPERTDTVRTETPSRPVTPEPVVVTPETNVPIPRPRPRPENLVTERPAQAETKPSTTEDTAPAEEPSTSVTTPTPESERPTDTATTTDETTTSPQTPVVTEEETSDVSEEVSPAFNLIYYTPNGALYSEIPNPQSQQRFPILRVTAKIDSRSPLFNKKHSHPIKDLDVEIVSPESLCKPIAQISSNNDIIVMSFKTKDQTDVAQLQACTQWFQTIRNNNFEMNLPDLQTDKGSVTGKFSFVLSQ